MIATAETTRRSIRQTRTRDDYGVAFHESVLRAVQAGAEYDQLDIVNLASMEHLLRSAQLIEYYHRERSRQEGATSSKDSKVGLDMEEQTVMLGVHQSQGNLMIAPDLITYTSKELERQSAIDKQSRKAREERALRRRG